MRAIVAKRTKPCHGCSQPTLSTRRWGAATGRRESAGPSRRPFHRRRKTAYGHRMSRCSNEAAAPRHAAYAADGRTLGDNLPRMQARACRHRGAPGRTLTPFRHIHPMSRLILIAALILAGCASPIVFRDPQTGHTAECTTSNPAPLPSAKQDIDKCVAVFENLGWVRQ